MTEVMPCIFPAAKNELFLHILLLINILRANPLFSPLGFTLHAQFSAAEEAYRGETWQGNPPASPNITPSPPGHCPAPSLAFPWQQPQQLAPAPTLG